MAVTLKDIADQLGVSITTVSRALNGRGRISDATREEVRKKAAELGYDLNSQPQGETSRKRICIVINSRSTPRGCFYGTVMVGVENECQKHGSNVFFQTVSQGDDASLGPPRQGTAGWHDLSRRIFTLAS